MDAATDGLHKQTILGMRKGSEVFPIESFLNSTFVSECNYLKMEDWLLNKRTLFKKKLIGSMEV